MHHTSSLVKEDRSIVIPYSTEPSNLPLICFSHLRWDFVYQRPQHLMTRFARTRKVLFIEEHIVEDGAARLDVRKKENGLIIITPILSGHMSSDDTETILRRLLDDYLQNHSIKHFIAWYYTPMMLPWTAHLQPIVTVYDCMDELSLFQGAPPMMIEREKLLLKKATIVFTGGTSLYRAKRDRHSNVHCFPSSIDGEHFSTARDVTSDPEDQADIPHPRLGFAGVIDERMDFNLIDSLARDNPSWHIVMIGPVVKIDPATLPKRPNINYLGSKQYLELPRYMAKWDISLIPFMLNDSTRYISPTKTPEYLSAGCPVVSTPIQDVLQPYGEKGLVEIGKTPEEFALLVSRILNRSEEERRQWLNRIDRFLSTMSWNSTYKAMSSLITALQPTDMRKPLSGITTAPLPPETQTDTQVLSV